MASDKHGKGGKWKNFCAQRKKKCSPCSNDYRANSNDPSPATWTLKHARRIYEAHHILCVSSVTQFIGKNKDIAKIVREVTWCINDTPNMIPLPLWGHTIRHYFTHSTAPPFKGLPQHNYDHNSADGFTKEIDDEMSRLASYVDSKKAQHKKAEAELLKRLNKLSGTYRGELKRRGGKRAGGTHNAWTNKKSDWYKAFSMANDGNETARPFPTNALKLSRISQVLKNVKGLWG